MSRTGSTVGFGLGGLRNRMRLYKLASWAGLGTMILVPIALMGSYGIEFGSPLVLLPLVGGGLLLSLAIALMGLDVVVHASARTPPRMTLGRFVVLLGVAIGGMATVILLLEASRP